jgi:hypothetical protein
VTAPPHPAFAGREIPREVALHPFHLRALTVADLDEDMAAIVETPGLAGLFGDEWPLGLTREADLIDLGWHQKEFALGRSFAWTVRDGTDRYLGCAYVYAPWEADGEMAVVTWVRAGEEALGPDLTALFTDWLSGPPWPAMRWRLATYP